MAPAKITKIPKALNKGSEKESNLRLLPHYIVILDKLANHALYVCGRLIGVKSRSFGPSLPHLSK